MALLFMDSFDHYATADATEKWTTLIAPAGTGSLAVGAYGRNGTNGLRSTGNGNMQAPHTLTVTVAPSGSTCICGFAIKYSDIAGLKANTTLDWAGAWVSTNTVFLLRYINDICCGVRVNTDGTLSVLSQAGSVLGTTTIALQDGVWAYLEFKVVVSTASGTFTIRVNGIEALALTSVDTRGAASADAWSNVRSPFPNSSSPVITSDVDDFVLLDGSGSFNNVLIGDVTVKALYPDGAGTTTGWTDSTGGSPPANWANVNEATPNDDTDYNATDVLTTKDTYTMQNCAVGADIRAVQILASVRKAAEGPGQVKLVARSNGVDYDGAAIGIAGTTYSYVREVRETDPGSGSPAQAWTESGWNAVEIGIKKTA